MLANGGAATVTMQHASSLPDSWSPSVTNGDLSRAALHWHVAGAQQVATVNVAADVSPIAGIATPWTGSVSLLCVQFGSGAACINYTNEGAPAFAAPYTGYYISAEYSGGGAQLHEYELYGNLQPNLWTRVEMKVTASSGSIAVTIPGVTNPVASSLFDPDTSVDVFIGPRTNGSTGGWAGYIDNVVAYVTRSK